MLKEKKEIIQPELRNLKIQPKIVCNSSSRTYVPSILLKGVWLEKMGFEAYKRVQVIVAEKTIIIQLDDN